MPDPYAPAPFTVDRFRSRSDVETLSALVSAASRTLLDCSTYCDLQCLQSQQADDKEAIRKWSDRSVGSRHLSVQLSFTALAILADPPITLPIS